MENAERSAVVDLSNCDREPIHLAGHIQPGGGLLAFDATTLELNHFSANFADWLGRSPAAGESLDNLFDAASAQALSGVAKGVRGVVRPLVLRWRNVPGDASVFAAAHVYKGMLFVEVENSPSCDAEGGDSRSLSLPLQVNLANQRLQKCVGAAELYDAVTSEMRSLTGFDRVMLYRFEQDGHGEVIGESVREGLESFLGLHYPATDIPEQARRLYVLNTVRGIADVNATPVPLLPPCGDKAQQPLDLSYCWYRAVSPIHVEYLRNMGVSASMSVSIVRDGRLWGLIACHHYSPKPLTLEQRAVSEVMGLLVANYLAAREVEELSHERDSRRKHYYQTLKVIAQTPNLWNALGIAAPELMGITQCHGVAIVSKQMIQTFGSTPSQQAVSAIINALEEAEREEPTVWHTNQLSELVPHIGQLANDSCGCLVLPLLAPEAECLLFFRDEFVREVAWAGDPEKAVVETADGVRLSPRLSFEEWRQTVTGQSRPWSQVDLEMAEELRSGLIELCSVRAAELARVNEELSKINADLDSFAYAASHDLREPLRSISQLVFLLGNELGEAKTPAVQERLGSLSRLAKRMDELVHGLLRLSRAGRGDLEVEQVSLTEVVHEAAEMVLGQPPPPGVRLEVLGEVEFEADFLWVRELLTNLISNAVKYNDSELKKIEIGADFGPPDAPRSRPVLFVRDNGIGIATGMREEVFQIFRRLHLPDEYGGGSGAGLAICKKIVARHGGKIWVDSHEMQGSTFFFTLSQDETDGSAIGLLHRGQRS